MGQSGRKRRAETGRDVLAEIEEPEQSNKGFGGRPKGSTKESKKETTEILEEILKISKQTLHCVSDVQRLYPWPSKNQKENYDHNPPSIYLKFLTKSEMRKFVKKLNEIRQTPKFKNLQLEYMCPPYLLNYYNASQTDT